ncbi:MAG: hypothetical protein DMF64_12040 [Acidobacteria bacterium]|nr:MAG: hypothetical protein DMF64_12040 [Acidobacteriota bacterium]
MQRKVTKKPTWKDYLVGSVVLGILAGLLTLVGYRIYLYTQKQAEDRKNEELQRKAEQDKRKEIAAQRIGDVDIEPGMTLGELKKIMRGNPGLSPDNIQHQADADFGDGLVYTWLYYDGRITEIPDTSKPIMYMVDNHFKGSVCGVHFGDSREQALAAVKRRYPSVDLEYSVYYSKKGKSALIDLPGWHFSIGWDKADRVNDLHLSDSYHKLERVDPYIKDFNMR